ncbi:MAG: hypothetical protein ACLGIV_12405 [Actinomycetes bacterium]
MPDELTPRELDVQDVELLPSRETLLLDTNWANVYASNSSLALNAASVASLAQSAAYQAVIVTQS